MLQCGLPMKVEKNDDLCCKWFCIYVDVVTTTDALAMDGIEAFLTLTNAITDRIIVVEYPAVVVIIILLK